GSGMGAAAGSGRKAGGGSSATVGAGPMPGSTPTAVPMVTPSSAHSRLAGDPASPKPCISEARSPISEPPGPAGQAEPDAGVEEQVEQAGQGPAVGGGPQRVR